VVKIDKENMEEGTAGEFKERRGNCIKRQTFAPLIKSS